jgi:hypothetical protein
MGTVTPELTCAAVPLAQSNIVFNRIEPVSGNRSQIMKLADQGFVGGTDSSRTDSSTFKFEAPASERAPPASPAAQPLAGVAAEPSAPSSTGRMGLRRLLRSGPCSRALRPGAPLERSWELGSEECSRGRRLAQLAPMSTPIVSTASGSGVRQAVDINLNLLTASPATVRFSSPPPAPSATLRICGLHCTLSEADV